MSFYYQVVQKRLWPLSNDIRSEAIYKIFKNKNGKYESMIQRMYKNIKKVNNESIITVATARSQKFQQFIIK